MNELVIFSDAGIDDLFAIEFLIRNNYHIKAIVASSGNGCSKRAYDVLKYFFNDKKIFLGKTSKNTTHVIHKAIEKFKVPNSVIYADFYDNINLIFDDSVKVVSIAPMTDIAEAYDYIKEKINSLLIMGGTYKISGNASITSEYNFYQDPVAANKIIQSRIEKTIVPLDVTTNFRFKEHHIKLVQNKKLSFLGLELLKHYLKLGVDSIPLHDLTTVMYLAHPDAYNCIFRYCDIILKSKAKGMLITDERQYQRKEPNSMLVTSINSTVLYFSFIQTFNN